MVCREDRARLQRNAQLHAGRVWLTESVLVRSDVPTSEWCVWTNDHRAGGFEVAVRRSGKSRASATITPPVGQKFREFSIMLSDALITSAAGPINAINYRTEPANHRFVKAGTDVSCMTSNTLADPTVTTSTQIGEPQTPIFKANPGDQVRFRMTHPLGTGNSEVFTIHGHNWQRNPYQNNSTTIAFNNLSQW